MPASMAISPVALKKSVVESPTAYTDALMNLLAKLQAIAAACNRPAARFVAFDLSRLIGQSIQLAPSVSEYFANVPEAAIDHHSFRILGTRDIYSYAKDAIPCCYTVQFGFIPIATELCGDSFAVDVRDGRVFWLSHEKYERDGIHPGWNEDHSDFLPPLPVDRNSIIETSEGRWESIADFLDDCLAQTKTTSTPS